MKKTVFLVTSQIKNFIQTYNNQLKNAYKTVTDEDIENSYLVLIYEDLKANLKDPNKFIDDYIDWAEKWNLPYTFYPYYGSFNKALLKVSHGIPHPFFELTLEKKNNEKINVVHQIAPGCLVLNVNKLKSIDFKFDTNYPTMFYLQDLVEKCYRAKLWISNCWYFDRLNSWEDLKEISTECKFEINGKNFAEEQKKYFSANGDCKFKDPNQIIEDIKKWQNGEQIQPETNKQVNLSVKNSDINISVPSELMEKKPSTNIEVNTQTTDTVSTSINVNADKVVQELGTGQKAKEIAKLAQMIDENNKKDPCCAGAN